MPNLRAVLDGVTPADGGYRTESPEGWTQGRTVYGGMTAALSAHAAGLHAAGLPPLRSAQFAFVGPAAGTLEFRVETLRQGRSATVVGVDCHTEGGIAARGLLTYGAARESQVTHARLEAGAAPAPDACPPFSPDRPMTGFFQNFELRLAGGARPFTGQSPSFDVWARHLDDAEVDPTVSLLALADALPPAAMVAFPAPAPISTMTWTIDLVRPTAPGPWRLLRSASEASAEGYSQQAMEVYAQDGSLMAVGRQTVAIFT